MNPESWKQRKVAVLGLGKSGVAVARLLADLGARVHASDARSREELADVVALLPAEVVLEAGSHSQSCLEADLIVLSPGVPRNLPVLQAADADGVEVIGEIELAYRFTTTPVIGITGTNGKTTTTTLVGEILKAAGLRAPVGGNIGVPLVTLAQEPADFLVAEVSSFQLESVVSFRPRIAAWLNFTDDHLNRHHTREAYFAAKRQLFERQTLEDRAVLNADDPALAALGPQLPGRVFMFGKHDLPQGATVADGVLLVRDEAGEHPVLPVAELALRGAHNLENCLAATAIAHLAGVPAAVIAEVLRTFQGVEHRIEPVLTLDGAQWINDSKGTNYDSTIKAIEAFTEPLVLIAGGRDKGGAITPLVEAISRRVKHVVLLGEAAPYFERVLRSAGYEDLTLTTDLPAAIAAARAQARPGDVVLFSPACTSFDLFRNYEERGRTFKALVRELVPADGPAVAP